MKDFPYSREEALKKLEDAQRKLHAAETGETQRVVSGPGGADDSERNEVKRWQDYLDRLERAGDTEEAAGLPSLVSWVVAFTVTILSFGGLVLLVGTRAAPFGTPSPQTTGAAISTTAARAAVATTSPRQQTEAPQAVRVVSTSGSAQPLGGSNYRVTFAWVLDGARDGDPAVVRFFSGSRQVSEQRGLLSSNIFDPSTGTLTLVTSQECTSEGWSAELVSIRSQSPGSESTARVPGATCR